MPEIVKGIWMFKYGLYWFSVIPNFLKNGSLYKELLYDKI